MERNVQQSSAAVVTVVVVVVGLGLMCLVGFVVVGGWLFLGRSYQSPSRTVTVSAPPLPAPTTLQPARSYHPPASSGQVPPNLSVVPVDPSAGSALPPLKPVLVNCDAEGQLEVEGEAVEVDELLKRLADGQQRAIVTLRIDSQTRYGRVVELQTQLGEAGHIVNLRLK
jgi:hypothetical protein